jgi:hypothetical protein
MKDGMNCLLKWKMGKETGKGQHVRTQPRSGSTLNETTQVAYQKIDYIHYNPLTERWLLAEDPCDYYYSSAKYYLQGEKRYSFLKDLRNEF